LLEYIGLIDAKDRRLGRYENQRASVERASVALAEAKRICSKQLQIARTGGVRALARTASLFVSIVTAAMIYRRATMCVQVSAERNERLLTALPGSNAADLVEARRAAAFFLGRYTRRDSFIEVSIGSYNNYLSRIRGAYSPLPPAPYPRPSAKPRCLLLDWNSASTGAERERGETADSCSIRRVLSRPR